MAGWNPKILHAQRRIQSLKTASKRLDEIGWKSLPRITAEEDRESLFALPTLDRHSPPPIVIATCSAARHESQPVNSGVPRTAMLDDGEDGRRVRRVAVALGG